MGDIVRVAKATFIAVAWVLPVAVRGSGSAAISGLVVDGSGAPIAGALVLYRRVQAPAVAVNGNQVATAPPLASGVSTGANGTFAVSGLPPATYNLCAYGVRPSDLGSCEWGQGTTRVDLTSGTMEQLTFQVNQGTLLIFQVQDPRGQIRSPDLQAAGGALALSGANFGIGVWAGSRYARATLISANAATRQYQVAIPKTGSVRLFLDTSLGVVDAGGSAIPSRQPSTLIMPAGQAQVTVSMTVP